MDRQALARLAKGVASDRRVQAATVGLVAVSVSTYLLFPGFFIGFPVRHHRPARLSSSWLVLPVVRD